MSRSRDVANIVTVAPGLYATDSEVASTLTGYVTPSSSDTLTNKTLTDPVINGAVLKSAEEIVTTSATAASGTVDIDLVTSSVHYYTSDASANWTFNIRGDSSTTLNSILNVGASISCVFLITNGSTAYYPNEYLVDGGSATVYFQGGTWPSSGNALSVDAYTFTVLKTADATFTVFGAQTQFGN